MINDLLKNKKFTYLLIALVIVVPLEILSLLNVEIPLILEISLFSIIIILFGRGVIKNGLESLIHFNFSNINLLMTIAVIGAAYLGEFEEAAIIIVLFSLGETLEEFGIDRSQGALKELVDNSPKSAQLKGREDRTLLENLKIGEIVIIKPGDQIPLDGTIVRGSSLVDESAITGEPLPKSKITGDLVYAGTHNTGGYLEVQITKDPKDTTLSKIINLAYNAAEKKSRTQRFIEKFAGYYVPSVIIISVALVIIPVFLLGQPFNPWFIQALTILLISCPCALVISTPISVFSAIGNASKKGILIKGGLYIEEIGNIKALALDKTRTLTKGEPIVSDIVGFNGASQDDVLECISGIEALSEHPVAKSVVDKAKQKALNSHEFKNFESIMGKGVKGECAICSDAHHCVGSLKFITEEHAVNDEVIKKVEEFEKQGKTTIVMSDHNRVTGVIGVMDEVRPESKSLINQLKEMGITPVMLTGDNTSAANYVSQQLGITEVRSQLLPQNKVEEIQALLKKYSSVGMIGDGVNDAPALATASVGIAMGAIGSDAAIENADIALMNNNLSVIPYLIRLSKTTVAKIRFNTALAIGVKALFLIFAFVGVSNLALAIFADVGVTVFVILNSLRLYGYNETTL